MRRGEIYWANLDPRSGSEQRGFRPVIVVSNDAFTLNDKWQSVIVVPLSTSENQRRRGPTAVSIMKGDTGLPSDSVALCHQVTTLDRAKLVRLQGTISHEALKRVELGLSVALQLA